ncbi:MAG: hypothetical protein JOZ29_15630 [Deltaproteobacteria bacterium]|nr:hypothetical protein [Deltaproteobacteria bacterium]
MQIYFDLAQTECPAGLRVEDYESHELFEVEVQWIEQGTRKWARYTGATLKFRNPEQRVPPLPADSAKVRSNHCLLDLDQQISSAAHRDARVCLYD